MDELIVITSHCGDPEMVVADLARKLSGRALAGGLIFCSHRFAKQPFARSLQNIVGQVPLVGCTSAGELSDRGYDEDSVVFIGFPADSFRMAIHCFDDLDRFDPAVGGQAIRVLASQMTRESLIVEGFVNQAALFLVDGLSHREELLAMTVQDALGKTLLVGGSSGDGMRFRETAVMVGGRFLHDAAVVVMLASRRPLRAFSAHHYLPGGDKMVVTAADPKERVVYEINARPAAEEYRRVAGGGPGPLDSAFFAAHPPMVRAGGNHYVRAIQSVNGDGSLTFYCAIDVGVVLTVGEPVDRLSQLEAMFDEIETEVGEIDHVIGFDCVLNRIDAESRQMSGAVSQLYSRRGVVGFNTYGEQFRAAHINQTLSGLAIGR
ncbi:hypothetical protein Y88_0264 [Novosphingobium nitrogenifigens DSM 19370]|uniref:FIST domain containing protein n=1 Tax=Novosphingobium nitrogenifigens DSM 19370 TaxID=983920 RepID=F1ZB90_9SPHN|nr:hypothetical protein Y88_0264 [Novosphingobium nitrogenifigens DSM 19370]